MQRTIYHGASQIIRSPRFGTGASGNDFGLGFYCTENPSLASEWAAGRSNHGFANRYTIETDGLRIINLNSPEYCILHWLSVLLTFRDFDVASQNVYHSAEYIRTVFSVDYQNCDCMIGFRADNSNFYFAQRFLDGAISYRELNEAVRMSDTGRQFVLKSNRAFDRVIFDGYTIAWRSEVYPRMISRDRQAMQRFADMTRPAADAAAASGLFVSQIVSEGISAYDPRLSF